MSKFYIPYLRLSKKQSPKAGEVQADYYGIEAQRKTINDFLRGEGTLLKEYIEIETGTRKGISRRVEIAKAVRQCKDTGATLIVAKLDRLARDVEFVANVLNSGIEVLFCDFPHSGKLVIMIMAAVAQYEAERISQRTKEGLAVAKSRGVKLGGFSRQTQQAGTRASIQSRRDNYHETANVKIKGRLEIMRNRDDLALPEICAKLNEEGLRSTRGKQFTPRLITDILRAQK